MTAPGGAFGESSHDDEANPPPAGERAAPEQPVWDAPWDPPTPPTAAAYPPPTYPPPSYSAGYPPEYQAGYPPEYPPPIPAPPGYQQPPGYGGSPYPPGPQYDAPPAGYWPPPNPGGYPGGYYPAPDYQWGYGLPQGPSQSGVNGMAIGALISSFTGLFCCIGSIVAIVLGTVALDQIKRTRQDGYALAVAGIVIGVATMLINVIIVVVAVRSR
jgi:Domain of unknown function (DUF4190)